MSIVEWQYGAEVWLLPEGSCLNCLKAWRMNTFARETDEPPPPHLRPLIDAHKAAMRTDQSTLPRRIDAVTGLAREHVLNQHPDCANHEIRTIGKAHASAMMSDNFQEHCGMRRLSNHDLKQAAQGFVDSHIGLIRGITEFRNESPMSGASARLRPLAGPQDIEYGYGRSGMPAADRVTAVAEAVERWGGFRPCLGVDIIEASKSELGDQAVDPRDFILHQDDPGFVHWAPYDESTTYEWVWGWSARRKAPILVPLQLVYFGMSNPLGGRFVDEISNGCAGGGSVREAALYGLLEVIERDAFLTSWHSSRLVDEIAPDVLDDWGRGLVARLSGEGVELALLDIGCGLPGHAVVAELRDTQGIYLPAIVQAAAAHPDPVKACKAALQEAAGMLSIFGAEEMAERRLHAERLLKNPQTVMTMEDHAAQGDAQSAVASKGFRRSGRTIAPAPSSEGDASVLFDEYSLATLDHAKDVIIVDQSYTPVREKGLHTVKVLAPGLHSMTFGHTRTRLSHDRLSLFAQQNDWRLEPHIFP